MWYLYFQILIYAFLEDKVSYLEMTPNFTRLFFCLYFSLCNVMGISSTNVSLLQKLNQLFLEHLSLYLGVMVIGILLPHEEITWKLGIIENNSIINWNKFHNTYTLVSTINFLKNPWVLEELDQRQISRTEGTQRISLVLLVFNVFVAILSVSNRTKIVISFLVAGCSRTFVQRESCS